MRIRFAAHFLALMLVAGSTSIAAAQDKPQDYAAALKADCAKELKAQCKGVVEGRGRLLACLYARQEKLSARCSGTVDLSLERWGEMIGALANVRRVCEVDVRRLCAGVKPGNGNLVDCLWIARKSVSAQCNTTLDLAFLRP